MMRIDLRSVPFSRYGSYLAISLHEREGERSLVLRDLGGGDQDPGTLLRIIPEDESGQALDTRVDADETELRIGAAGCTGRVRVCLPDEDRALIRSEGAAFCLDFTPGRYHHLDDLGAGAWEYHSYAGDVKLRLRLQDGACSDDRRWETVGHRHMKLHFKGPIVTLDIERYVQVPRPSKAPFDYERSLTAVRAAFDAYREALPRCRDDRYSGSRDLAAYITWSSVVHPSGLLRRYAMYMSNNWMTNLWSWDNCFNAIGLASHQPELGYDQFIAFADFQAESGVLPDYANDRFISFACCKPPIYGWAYRRMMELHPVFTTPARLGPVYAMIEGVERYWRVHRTRPGWPLPYYNHGNDSGWDNATVFSEGCPVTSPDLPAYLILLYEALDEIARRFGRDGQAREWSERAESMTDLLVRTLWDGTRFRSWDAVKRRPVAAQSCLIDWMPVIVAHRLPADIRRCLVSHLTGSTHRTRYGLATEAPDSPHYRSGGYWRGPIWAPVTLLIADGLRRCGEREAAASLARDFCEATLIGGMAENFDAETAAGLVDPAFTWTSSVLLHFTAGYPKADRKE